MDENQLAPIRPLFRRQIILNTVLVFHKEQRDENSLQIYQVCKKLWQCAHYKLCAFWRFRACLKSIKAN